MLFVKRCLMKRRISDMPRDVLDRVLNGDKVVIKVKRLVPEARMPERAHEGDKGADVFACSKSLACWFDNKDVICYGTGLALEIPVGYWSCAHALRFTRQG